MMNEIFENMLDTAREKMHFAAVNVIESVKALGKIAIYKDCHIRTRVENTASGKLLWENERDKRSVSSVVKILLITAAIIVSAASAAAYVRSSIELRKEYRAKTKELKEAKKLIESIQGNP